MAITLVSDITSNTNPILLSASPGCSTFALDSEILTVVGPVPPTWMTVARDGSGGAGRQVDPGAVAVTVARGQFGTEAVPHAASTAILPLYPVFAGAPGVVYVP